MNLHRQFLPFICLISIAILVGCTKKDYSDMAQPMGTVNFYATDAPIDNPEITGAFVTISGIKINGDTNLLKDKTTIDLLAYQAGNTKNLGSFPVEAGEYEEIELILDLQQDAFGQTPGCYIATRDGIKHNIAISTLLRKSLYLTAEPIVIEPSQSMSLVLDFDLRKAIKIDTGSISVKYQFVPDNQLQYAIRCLEMNRTGSIKGSLDYDPAYNETIIVMAYQRGHFSKRTETNNRGSDGIEFPNASNSTKVKSSGDFTLAFLLRGDYELVFASYEDGNGDGILEYKGLLDVNLVSGFKPDDINVEANNTVNLGLESDGLLPI